MNLKPYQSDTLAVLRRFFEEARVAGPAAAYGAIVREPEQAARLGRYGGAYRELEALPDTPYVCLRLPTGGGKTVLAAHAVAVARDAWIEKDYPLVLWLTPTTTIRRQTAEALKNPRHPYRRALDDAFQGRVRVFDIADFAQIRPHDLRDRCCVVVGTIQTLRVTNTEGRRVYADNEEMEPHFAALPAPSEGLERTAGGRPKYSFANLLHLHRPLMIVDEAHNAVTGLSREMQRRVNPCAIVEFTATPRLSSNILHSVTAQELKAAEMIKLPIVLAEHESWQNAVADAIAKRAELAEIAESDPDYIRPIVLFQAQPKDREVTVEVLRTHLIETENILPEKIAVATGDQRDLDGIDLFDPKCRIEYVVTVEALKEGWDCSFAYAFCSVSRIHSAVDVEQLLGRVLRMPHAARRRAPELNRAYAFLSEPSFGEAARALADRLVAMGFQEEEAEQSIEPLHPELAGDGLFGRRTRPTPVFRHTVAASAALLDTLRAAPGVSAQETADGRVEIAVTGRVDAALERAVAATLPEPERRGFAEAVAHYRLEVRDRLSPAERGEPFIVPRLMAEVQGSLELADTDRFIESHHWSLLDHSPRLSEAEFAIRETAHSFEIDIDGNRVVYGWTGERDQSAFDVDVPGWEPEGLAVWLAGHPQVRAPDLHPSELLRWTRDLVGHLVGRRGIQVAALMRCKYILARKVRDRLDAIRQEERGRAFQQYLFAPAARVEVSFDEGFTFRDGMYADCPRWRGSWKPRRHFLGPDNVPSLDGAAGGEEMQCAQALDSVPGLKFWVRNVARHPASFWLPTATDKFYPDFVAQMDDGRLLVVEYKGGLTAETADTDEKRTVGLLWERRSGGRGLFLVVEKQVAGREMREQMMAKIRSN